MTVSSDFFSGISGLVSNFDRVIPELREEEKPDIFLLRGLSEAGSYCLNRMLKSMGVSQELLSVDIPRCLRFAQDLYVQSTPGMDVEKANTIIDSAIYFIENIGGSAMLKFDLAYDPNEETVVTCLTEESRKDITRYPFVIRRTPNAKNLGDNHIYLLETIKSFGFFENGKTFYDYLLEMNKEFDRLKLIFETLNGRIKFNKVILPNKSI